VQRALDVHRVRDHPGMMPRRLPRDAQAQARRDADLQAALRAQALHRERDREWRQFAQAISNMEEEGWRRRGSLIITRRNSRGTHIPCRQGSTVQGKGRQRRVPLSIWSSVVGNKMLSSWRGNSLALTLYELLVAQANQQVGKPGTHMLWPPNLSVAKEAPHTSVGWAGIACRDIELPP
jgi:hypothetical protein